MALADELVAAIGGVTVVARRRPATRAAVAGGLAFYPAVGLAVGAVAAVVAAALDGVSGLAAAAGGVAALAVATGARPSLGVAAATALLAPGDAATVRARLGKRPAVAGFVVAALALAVRVWAAARLPPPARTAAFLLAPMLGRWAVTVQCYGGTAPAPHGRAAAMIARARFREFGTASTIAFAATLGLIHAAGLVVLVAAALVTVGVRLAAHRRTAGMTGRLLDATTDLVETTTFVVLALLP